MTTTYFKLVEVPQSELRIGDPHIIVATKTQEDESINTFRETRVDWACHLREGSAAVVNTGALIRRVESEKRRNA